MEIFQYSINWGNVDSSIMKKLADIQKAGEIAEVSDMVKLKKWLMTDLLNTYESSKDNYYVKTKTSGTTIYESVASQVTKNWGALKECPMAVAIVFFYKPFHGKHRQKGQGCRCHPTITSAFKSCSDQRNTTSY